MAGKTVEGKIRGTGSAAAGEGPGFVFGAAVSTHYYTYARTVAYD